MPCRSSGPARLWSNGTVVGRGTWIAATSAAAAAVFGWAEWTTWRASREFYPAGAAGADQIVPGETVLVLGCPSPALQRWRVRIAIRSTDPERARFVFSGGAVRTQISEAQMMANYAKHTLGVPTANIVIEDQSRTTVENVVNSAPLMADSPAIKIASNTLHAHRARRIIMDESPELAARLVPARDYLPAEGGPLHAVLVAHEYYRRRRARLTRQSATKGLPHRRDAHR
jgi:hypothetical protein